ncbi:MAG: ABC transporter permease [Vicinamibacteria bacterium]|nr:ABC transporter permease [Vicinamibacteria bacterium]
MRLPFGRGRRSDELDEELRSHLAMAMRDLVERGVPPREAELRARREFGNVNVVRENTRDAWGPRWWEEALRDVRFGFRALRRDPGFALVALGSLALGIGANTAVFTLTDATLNRALPFAEPERLLTLSESNPAKGRVGVGASPANLLDWKRSADVFSSLAGYYSRSVVVTEAQDAEVIIGTQVTEGFFPAFGVAPLLGRVFTSEELAAGLSESPGSKVAGPVVIGERLWRRRFGGSAEAVGRTVSLDGVSRLVVGVMPASFIASGPDVEAWLPWDLERAYAHLKAVPRDSRFIKVAGRLRPGVTPEAAAARMDVLAATLAERHPDTNKGWTVSVAPIREQMVGESRAVLVALFVAVLLVLLLTASNVATLQIARGFAREREMAVRLALGVGRGRLVRQLLTESLVLAVMGGALGLLLGGVLVRSLQELVPKSILAIEPLRMNARVLLFAFAATLLSGLASGVLPALRGSGEALVNVLRSGMSQTAPRGHARHLLVAAQAALALLLVTGAFLLVRTVLGLRAVDPGFETRNQLVIRVALNTKKYRSNEERNLYFDALEKGLRSQPGVTRVGATTVLPMSEGGTDFNRPYWRADRARPEGAPVPVDIRMITTGYPGAMGIRTVSGRSFDERDAPDRPLVVMINERLARTTWKGEDPVGKQVVLDYLGGQYPYEIVGVLSDTRYYGLRSEPRPEVFIPYRQNPYPALFFVVHTTVPPETLMPAARALLDRLDPTQPAQLMTTLSALTERSLNRERLAAWLLGVMAALALLLCGLGVWGLIEHAVSQATREIGLRMALGARPGQAAAGILGRAFGLVSAGVLVGVALAWPLSSGLRSLVFGISPQDPLTLLTSASVLLLSTLAASLRPLRRAVRIDPAAALRS